MFFVYNLLGVLKQMADLRSESLLHLVAVSGFGHRPRIPCLIPSKPEALNPEATNLGLNS